VTAGIENIFKGDIYLTQYQSTIISTQDSQPMRVNRHRVTI